MMLNLVNMGIHFQCTFQVCLLKALKRLDTNKEEDIDLLRPKSPFYYDEQFSLCSACYNEILESRSEMMIDHTAKRYKANVPVHCAY